MAEERKDATPAASKDASCASTVFLNNTFTPDPVMLSTFVRPGSQEIALLQSAASTQLPLTSPGNPLNGNTSLLDDSLVTQAVQSAQPRSCFKKCKRIGRSLPVIGARNGTSWTSAETSILQEVIDFHLDISTTFDRIGRTTDAVKRKWRKMLVAQEKRAHQSSKQDAETTTFMATVPSPKQLLGASKASDLSDSDSSDAEYLRVPHQNGRNLKRTRSPSSDLGDGQDNGILGARKRRYEAESRSSKSCDSCRIAHKRCKHEELSMNSISESRDGKTLQCLQGYDKSCSEPNGQISTQRRHARDVSKSIRPKDVSLSRRVQRSVPLAQEKSSEQPKKRGPGRPRKTDCQRACNQSPPRRQQTSSMVSDHYVPRKRRSVQDYEFSEAFVKGHLLDADQVLESPPKRWSGRRVDMCSRDGTTKEDEVDRERESAIRSTLPGNTSDGGSILGFQHRRATIPLQPSGRGNTPTQQPRQRKKRVTRVPMGSNARSVGFRTLQASSTSTTAANECVFQESPDHQLKQPFIHGDRFLPLRPSRPWPLSPEPFAKPNECGLKGYVLLSQLLNPELVSQDGRTSAAVSRIDSIALRATGSALDELDPFANRGFAFSDSAVRDDRF